MKIIATSDLHFGSSLYSDTVKQLIREINIEGPDAVMILGDHSSGNRGLLRKLFELYSELKAPLLLCMGNHDFWVSKNQFNHEINSLKQRGQFIDLCKEFKFHPLDEREKVIGNVAFVGGSMWYDDSFRPEGISEENCTLKRTTYFDGAIPRTTMWMDCEFVKMPFGDKEFCELELERLEKQLRKVKNAKTIVSGTHFLPFSECVTRIGKLEWDYFNAFMGSKKIGEMLAKSKVKYAFFGHSHSSEVEINRFCEVGGVQAYNAAYSAKMPYVVANI